ncbi:hypothetical protein [Marivita geojedonensis]|uniref:hypothetical protein n=1 Tax=Marivita geojedonensis TaxID=1123756 RepID=UPI000D425FFE|nr:hypothetical protein [Marivita geojedonensis]PRY81705.1 hypothetical protein CLV76_101245 [Marivita geojedonensis]
MTTFVPTAQDFARPKDRAADTVRPPGKGGPVLMADCVTPVAGETLLSLLWKRWDRED